MPDALILPATCEGDSIIRILQGRKLQLTCLGSTTQVLNLNLRTQLPKSGALYIILLFPERVVCGTSESELGSAGKTLRFQGGGRAWELAFF